MNPLRPSEYDLEQLLSSLLIDCKKEAIRRRIELSVCDDFVGSIPIEGEGAALKALLETVLDNTLQHSGASRISFSTRQLLRTSNDILLEFLLEDNGPSHRRARPLVYLRNIAAARRQIESLGGKSEIIATPGHGMVLKFILRCSYAAETMEGPATLRTGALAGIRVLVAEDNEINQRVIRNLLLAEGASVLTATDGKEAVDLLMRESVDVILMDIQMPGMDGIQATHYIRKVLRSHVPIIGLTATGDANASLLCSFAGMNELLQKPFTPQTLVARTAFYAKDELFNIQPKLKLA